MFFYRPWTGQGELSRPDDPLHDQLYAQFRIYRWLFGVLLGLTLLVSLVLNLGFLMAFVGNPNIRRQPHWTLLCLCVRDLLVTLILVPICLDWFVVNMGIWGGGGFFCNVAGFFDFYLATHYPLLLVAFAVILYTRKYSNRHVVQDTGLDLPMEDVADVPEIMIQTPSRTPSRAPSVAGSYSGRQPSRQPSVAGSYAGGRGGQRPPSRPPSVAGSTDGRRYDRSHSQQPAGPGHPARPFHVAPTRAGSVTGSIEGRLAAGRMTGGRRGQAPSLDGSRMSSASRPGSSVLQVPSRGQFRASSPLREVDETNCSIGDVSDLFDAASLDYPGREFDESPRGWDYLQEPEVRYHTWHTWLMLSTWFLALAYGIPAATMVEYHARRRPGCSVPVNPFENPYSYTINDAGFNFLLSFVVVVFFLPLLVVLILLALTCYHRRADKRFTTFLKIIVLLLLTFVVSRAPMDIVQLSGLIDASMGFNLRDPFELEYEIVLIWLTYLPLVLNPIVYFSFLTDYRRGAMKTVRWIFGCRSQEDVEEEKMARYKEDEIREAKDNVSKTQVSNML